MLTFDQPIPFDEAIAIVRRKGLLPTTLSSAQIADLSQQEKQRAIFSARMDKAVVLDVLQKMVLQLVSNQSVEGEDRYRSIPEAKAQLRAAMFHAGVPLAPSGTPAIQDFYSDARRQLMVETTVLDTLGFGRHVATQNVEMLWANPGLELVRFVVPKGGIAAERDWVKRWMAARATLIPADLRTCTDPMTSGRMVAQKNHPIWQALGDGAGGYTDVLGNSWAPFAFRSGMNTIEVTREECEVLGIIGPDEKITPETHWNMNEEMEASVEKFSAALQDALATGGLHVLNGVLEAISNSRRSRADGILGDLIAANTGFNPGEFRDEHGRWSVAGALGRLYDLARSGRLLSSRAADFRKLTAMEAQKIKQATGLDVDGYHHAISGGDIRHIINTHGSSSSEKPRGLLPVTREDIEALPRLLPRATKIEAGENRRGLETIWYTIPSGRNTYIVLEEVRIGRMQLAVKTMVKKKYRAASNAAFAAPSVASRTFRAECHNLLEHRGVIKSLLSTIQEGEAQ